MINEDMQPYTLHICSQGEDQTGITDTDTTARASVKSTIKKCATTKGCPANTGPDNRAEFEWCCSMCTTALRRRLFDNVRCLYIVTGGALPHLLQ